LGKFSTDLAADPEKSTSHKATTLSRPFTEAFLISLAPLPPAPIAAKFNWSLGAVNPTPPSTCLGTYIKEEAMATFFIKFLREFSGFSFSGCFIVFLFILIQVLNKETNAVLFNIFIFFKSPFIKKKYLTFDEGTKSKPGFLPQERRGEKFFPNSPLFLN
jgi:hypothetical protein